MSIDASEERLRRAKAREGAVLREKWQLDALLGVGGMASVYSATHRNNGKRVAVKMLHPELSVVPQIKARFLREGYASNQVAHPGVVSVLDDDVSEDGSVFLVMELLEGENLDQRRLRAGGTVDLLEVLWAMDQVLDVLVSAHAKGIIHRDIKPENLFLTTEASLKVLDFGLARVQRPQQSQGLTRTNMLMGTLDFMAPEQARGKWDGVGAQADLWSVGATMFMLLSGHPVHEEATLDTQLKAAAGRAARSLRAVRPDLPPAVITLVDRALAFEARDRWPDAAAMQEAVREAYVGGGGDNDGSGTLRPPPAVDTVTASSSMFQSDVTHAWEGSSQADPAAAAAARAVSEAPDSSDSDLDAPTQSLPDSAFDPLIPPAPLVPSVPSGPFVPPAPGNVFGADASATGLPLASPPPVAPFVADPPAVPAAPAPGSTKRSVLIALATLPVWLLLFWGVASLRGRSAHDPDTDPTATSASVTPSATAPDSATPPVVSASAEPPTPALSASAPPVVSATPSATATSPRKTAPNNGRHVPRGGPTPVPRPQTKRR